MKKNTRFGLAAVLAATLVFGASVSAASDSAAPGADEYAAAKELIKQELPCSGLSQEQMENLGDYYMEQMMPGQAHKNMDQILGGEGSESLMQMHILMARRWYCGDAAGMGMMGMMTGGANSAGMMGGNWNSAGKGNYPYGMMGGGAGSAGYGNFPGNMMGGSFGSGSNWGYGMMGLGTGLGGGITMVLTAVLLIAGIAAAVKYLVKR